MPNESIIAHPSQVIGRPGVQSWRALLQLSLSLNRSSRVEQTANRVAGYHEITYTKTCLDHEVNPMLLLLTLADAAESENKVCTCCSGCHQRPDCGRCAGPACRIAAIRSWGRHSQIQAAPA